MQLTTGDFDEENFLWSKDGSKIYFISDRTKESYYQPGQNAIYSVPAGGGAVEMIT